LTRLQDFEFSWRLNPKSENLVWWIWVGGCGLVVLVWFGGFGWVWVDLVWWVWFGGFAFGLMDLVDLVWSGGSGLVNLLGLVGGFGLDLVWWI
jgi:hypothetical protein